MRAGPSAAGRASAPASESPADTTSAGEITRFWFTEPKPDGSSSVDTTRLVATRANGRPAVIVCRRALDGREERFCVMTLEVDGDRIAGFDGFLDPQLVRVFEGPGSQALGPRHRAG